MPPITTPKTNSIKTLEVYRGKVPEDSGSVLTAAHLYMLRPGFRYGRGKDTARETFKVVEPNE